MSNQNQGIKYVTVVDEMHGRADRQAFANPADYTTLVEAHLSKGRPKAEKQGQSLTLEA